MISESMKTLKKHIGINKCIAFVEDVYLLPVTLLVAVAALLPLNMTSRMLVFHLYIRVILRLFVYVRRHLKERSIHQTYCEILFAVKKIIGALLLQ